MNRRNLLLAAATSGAACALPLLGGCAAPALPAVQWVRMPLEIEAPGLPAPASGASREVWQWVGGGLLPGHLDHDLMWLPSAGSRTQRASGAAAAVRWAEPLRDALPRLLRHDLSRHLGAPLWVAPLPPGLMVSRQLRLELLAFELQPGLQALSVAARYSVTALDAEPAAREGPAPQVGAVLRAGDLAFVQPVVGAGTEAQVLAHRAALATLAARLSDVMLSRR